MPSCAVELACLSLSIERLMDAELLFNEEGERLLAEIEAARHSLETGDLVEMKQHLTQFLCDLRGLVHTDRLHAAEGRTVVETAGRILSQPAD